MLGVERLLLEDDDNDDDCIELHCYLLTENGETERPGQCILLRFGVL